MSQEQNLPLKKAKQICEILYLDNKILGREEEMKYYKDLYDELDLVEE